MLASRSRLRGPALTAAAALTLHQLRYLLAPDGHVYAAEHAYIPFAVMLAMFLTALAGAELGVRVAQARDDGTGEGEPRPLWQAWLATAAALVAIFVGQELLEALLAGAPAQDPLAGGGLWALPLALVLAGLVALALHLAGVAVRAAARRRSGHRPRPAPALRLTWRPGRAPASVLARNLAGRAPPLTS
jgi:hypothetical protein